MKRNEIKRIKDSLCKILFVITWSIVVFAVVLALVICYYSSFKEITELAVAVLILFLIFQIGFLGYMMYSLGVIHDSM